MTLRYLLDTSTLSAVVARSPSRSVLRRLSRHGPQCAVPVVVWHELTYGCERLPRGKRKAELEGYLRDVVLKSFPILAYDVDAANWHGIERARLESAGKSAPFVDGQIAAIAYVHELVVVTANTRDFTRFKGVVVENWMGKD